MTIKGRPVSKTSDGDWCAPNQDYAAHNAIEIKKECEVVAIIGESLPPCDERWPKGAPIPGYFHVGGAIVKVNDPV